MIINRAIIVFGVAIIVGGVGLKNLSAVSAVALIVIGIALIVGGLILIARQQE
jgi:uncharacterized membrane protein HdeD (DUF308 family)